MPFIISIYIFRHYFLLLSLLYHLIIRLYYIKWTHQLFTYIHYCTIIIKLTTIIRRTKYCHQLLLPKKLIPLFNYLHITFQLPDELCKSNLNRLSTKISIIYLAQIIYLYLSHYSHSTLFFLIQDQTIINHIKDQ